MAPQGSSTGSGSQSDGGSGIQPGQVSNVTAPDAQVQQAVNASGGVMGIFDGRAFTATADAQNAMNSQATQLAAEMQTRGGPSLGNPNYAAQSSQELHTALSSASSTDVVSISDSWNRIGNTLGEISDDLNTAANTAASGWQGQAASTASAFHKQVTQWATTTAAAAQVTSVNTYNQSDAVSTAQNSMPTPYSYTMNDAWKDILTSSDPIGAVMQAETNLNKAAQNHNQSVQVAQQYDTSLSQASAKMPAMAPTPTFGTNGGSSGSGTGSSGASGTGRGGSGGGSGGDSPHLSGSGSPGGSGSSGRGSGDASPVTAPPSTGQPAPIGPNGPTNTQGYAPPITTYPGGNTGLPGSNTGGNPGQSNNPGAMPVGGMPMGGGFGPGGSDTAYSGGGYGGGSGGSGFGPGGSSAGSSGSSSGVGARSAAGAASAEESAISGGAAGVRGAAGSTGAGGMGGGAGRGKGQGDSEHKTAAYLVEGDPDSIFGTDQRTAPPVIGG